MAGNTTILEMARELKNGKQQHQLAISVDEPEWRVFEVPALVREKSPTSFQNKGTELGLHRRTSTPTRIDLFKLDLARILHSKLLESNSSWVHFAKVVLGDVSVARRAYGASSGRFDADEDVQNLLAMDALFLVVFFKFINGKQYFLQEFEAVAAVLEEIISGIDMTDFFLLENQVPMYLLQAVIGQLCKIGAGGRVPDPKEVEDELEVILYVAVIQLNPFSYPHSYPGPYSKNRKQRLLHHLESMYPIQPLEKSLITCQHLLDCLYRVICGHSLPFKAEMKKCNSNLDFENIPSASRLAAIGIQVVGTVPTVGDVKLSGVGYWRSAKLELPKVSLYDYSEAAFHNLALHEQLTYGGLCGDLRCYTDCMASLCMDSSDLQLLSEQGVIDNHVTSKDNLLDMWDRTRKGITTPMFLSNHWVKCNRRIHKHRGTALKRWRKECWTLFFAKPWTLVSVLAGTALLFFSATQSWFTAFPRT